MKKPDKKSKFLLTYLFPLIGLWGVVCPLGADITNRGTEFWLTFPQGNGSNNPPSTLQFLVTCDVNTTGQVQIPSLAFSAPFTITAGTSAQVVVPSSAEANMTDGVAVGLGIHITAANPVAVYGLNYVTLATDGYMGLPVESLGTEYIVQTYYNQGVSFGLLLGSEFAVVGTQDCTHVSINLPNTYHGSHTPGVPYGVTLYQGDVYQLQDLVNDDDVSGTIVNSDKPVAVFGAHVCDFVPYQVQSCNHLVEELWPTQWWGTNFITMPLATRTGGDTFRFLASVDGTIINATGSLPVTLNRGKKYEHIYSTPLHITANNPIYVMQYSNGQLYDNNSTSDPTMISIPPVSGFETDYTLSAPVSAFAGNYENILVPAGGQGTVTIDGSQILASSYTAIPPAYYGVQVSVGPGVHHLTGPVSFGVIAYGYDNADAYGYPGGMLFSSNTPVPTPTPGGPCASPTPSNTPTPTPTTTPTNTPTNTLTLTATLTRTNTSTATPSSTPTSSPTSTPTLSPTLTLTPTVTLTPTNSPTPTPFLTPTLTPTSTPTSSPTESLTDTPTPSPTNTPTDTPSDTPTPTPTLTPTVTPTASPTNTGTLPPNPTPTFTFTPTLSPTDTNTPTQTPTPTPTDSPTKSATPTPTNSPTQSQTPTSTFTFTLTPSFTNSPTLTISPTSTNTGTPTFSPTLTPTTVIPCEMHVWPVPFNPARAVGGVLKVSCMPTGGSFSIYTLSGEWVGRAEEANGMSFWDGRNQKGVFVSPGIYYYVIQQTGQVLKEGKIIVAINP